MKTTKHIARYGGFTDCTTKPVGFGLETGGVREAVTKAKCVSELLKDEPLWFRLFVTALPYPVEPNGRVFLPFDAKIMVETGRYFLVGEVQRFDDVHEFRPMLCSSMKIAGHPTQLEARQGTHRSWHFFDEEDSIVDPENGEILVRGDSRELVEYRKRKLAEWEADVLNDRNGVKT